MYITTLDRQHPTPDGTIHTSTLIARNSDGERLGTIAVDSYTDRQTGEVYPLYWVTRHRDANDAKFFNKDDVEHFLTN